ncbi:hypothetical protein UlMin_032146 [Ulmus minor]
MAAHHIRSNSLPSRQHPLIPEFEEQLCRLRSSEAASSSTLGCKLSGLEDLHDFVEKLLLLPLNQQALSREQSKKCIDELLDGSLRLLDVCNIAKDALLQTKECTQELQSIMRRRVGLAGEVKKFLASRKMVKKTVHNAIRNLKGVENKCALRKDDDSATIVSTLRDVETITLAVFESLLSFISGSKSQKPSGWSMVSKMLKSNKVACEETTKANEFGSAEAALLSLISPKAKKSDEVNAQILLQKLEMCVQDLEEGIEHLFRRLIKIRVALLNVLNN